MINIVEKNERKYGLKKGEKYLHIVVDLGVLGKHELKAFPNRNKSSDKHPAFKGKNVAVWVNVKRDRPAEDVL